jgi:glutaredoxin
MKRLIPILIVGILVLSGLGAVGTIHNDIEISPESQSTKSQTHAVFAEYGTATWCGYCKYAHGALKNIYAEANYDFYYVSLVNDKNSVAAARINQYNCYGFPTVWFDGGYRVSVGASSIPGAQSTYQNMITQSGNRAVHDIDIILDVEWLGNAQMDIDVTVVNNEATSYDGHIRVYVTEIESSLGWKDTAGYPYTFAFLNYAFNQAISIDAANEWSDSITWNGQTYGYPNIQYGNLMVIAAVFNSEWNQGYSYPPSSNPFDAYYVDQTAGFPLADNVPPNEPNTPIPANEAVDVDLNANLYWTGGDPNPGDQVTYDVYFGTTNPPPLVNSEQTQTNYNPGTMQYGTTYYWKIIAYDASGESTEGPIWSFKTSLDPNPSPSPPEIQGPLSGKPNTQYLYRFSSIDPDGDAVFFYIDWGDGTVEEWVGPYASGFVANIQHTWYEKGEYEIKAKAKDSKGAESEWATLQIEMPVKRDLYQMPILYWLQQIMQRFPRLNMVVQHILDQHIL